MRVIAGRAKGHQLKGPKGQGTRPTSDKVRGALFGMLESLLEGTRPGDRDQEISPWERRRVLDLYAGTGALGIEALSRGAAHADFVELDRVACQVIRENLLRTKLASAGRIFCAPVRKFIAQFKERAAKGVDEGYDLVLIDAPYGEPGLEETLASLGTADLVRPGGWLAVEHGRRRALPESLAGLMLVKSRRHGDSSISIYSRRHHSEMAAAASGEGPGRT